MLHGRGREKDGEGRGDVDDGEYDRYKLERVEDSVTPGEGWKDEKLDEGAGNAVECEKKTNAIRLWVGSLV